MRRNGETFYGNDNKCLSIYEDMMRLWKVLTDLNKNCHRLTKQSRILWSYYKMLHGYVFTNQLTNYSMDIQFIEC